MKNAISNLFDNSSDQEPSSEEEDAGEEEEDDEIENESDLSVSESEEGNSGKMGTVQNGNMNLKIETEPKAETTAMNAAVAAVNQNKDSKGATTKTMVEFAIKSLNERSGSSVKAIYKFITANYAVEEKKRLNVSIKNYIKKGLATGTLKQSKGSNMAGSFKLAPKDSDKNKKSAKAKAKKEKEKQKDKTKAATKTTTAATTSTAATNGIGKPTKVQKKKPANATETDTAEPSKKAKPKIVAEPMIKANGAQNAVKPTKNKLAKRKSIGTLINVPQLAATSKKKPVTAASMNTRKKASTENVDTNNVDADGGAKGAKVAKKTATKEKK